MHLLMHSFFDTVYIELFYARFGGKRLQIGKQESMRKEGRTVQRDIYAASTFFSVLALYILIQQRILNDIIKAITHPSM